MLIDNCRVCFTSARSTQVGMSRCFPSVLHKFPLKDESEPKNKIKKRYIFPFSPVYLKALHFFFIECILPTTYHARVLDQDHMLKKNRVDAILVKPWK